MEIKIVFHTLCTPVPVLCLLLLVVVVLECVYGVSYLCMRPQQDVYMWDRSDGDRKKNKKEKKKKIKERREKIERPTDRAERERSTSGSSSTYIRINPRTRTNHSCCGLWIDRVRWVSDQRSVSGDVRQRGSRLFLDQRWFKWCKVSIGLYGRLFSCWVRCCFYNPQLLRIECLRIEQSRLDWTMSLRDRVESDCLLPEQRHHPA